MEGLQMGVMTETQTSIISPNASLPANPIHANQTPGSHGGADSRCRTDHEVENSAITPRGSISRPWSAWRPSMATVGPYEVGAPFGECARRYAPCCTWARSWRPVLIRGAKFFISGYSLQGQSKKSL